MGGGGEGFFMRNKEKLCLEQEETGEKASRESHLLVAI